MVKFRAACAAALGILSAPLVTGGLPVTAQQAQSSASVGQPSARAVLDKYCVTCHNQRLKTAGLMLDAIDPANVVAQAETWEKVVRKLRSRAMPPLGLPRPDDATYDRVAGGLETDLDRASAASPNAGRPTMHRLNRVEYTNAVRDLLALDIDGPSLLPADESGYGFDNIADVLTTSPALLQRYLIAAQKISRLAVGDKALPPSSAVYSVPRTEFQEDRVSEDLPLGSRGGIAVRHYFPVDAEYGFKVRLRRQFNSNLIRGINTREQLEVRIDGVRTKTFAVGGDTEAQKSADDRLQYQNEGDRDLEVRFPVKAGTRLVGLSFLERTIVSEGVAPERLPVGTISYWNNANALLGIDSIQISGPFNTVATGDTASRRQIFVCQPNGSRDEEACASQILGRLARRAFRRPVTKGDVQGLLTFYRAGRRDGDFEKGIQFAIEKVLVSLDFLFRTERDPARPAGLYRITDLDMASRLSFFLWSSIPDDELLAVAEKGKLKDPVVMKQQVERMLADPRSAALIDNFGGQWLHLRNVRVWAPDPHEYPEFDEALRDAFEQETSLFLDSQIRENRNVVDLLTANYTFVNERLARHYGIPNVFGEHFRRVTLPDDRRAGLLGHGSILTVTSYPTRTSPVLRGKWVLDNILGAPPPPPPPNVPLLEENRQGGKAPTSVRERLQQHRRNPVCATCHNRMDPLGFALENFDGIGRWRTLSEGQTVVDASGVFPDGNSFNGPGEFRALLLRHSDDFVLTVTQKLLTYALGRGVEYYDMPAVRRIIRDAGNDHRWSSIIIGVIKSAPFQTRMAQEPAAATVAGTMPDARRSQP